MTKLGTRHVILMCSQDGPREGWPLTGVLDWARLVGFLAIWPGVQKADRLVRVVWRGWGFGSGRGKGQMMRRTVFCDGYKN